MTAPRQFLATPAKMPQQWQPNLHHWNPFFCSHPDLALMGWRKWAAVKPDWIAKKSSSCQPDWYQRKVNNIRRTDYKAMIYHYEKPLKPTTRTHDNFVSVSGEVMRKNTLEPIPPNRSFMGLPLYPADPDEAVPAPNYGRYHPDYYQDPYRLNGLPTVKQGGNFHISKHIPKPTPKYVRA